LAVSANITANVNKNYNFGGYFLSLNIGDFRSKDKRNK
jgi:hypothetical protein